MNKQGQQYELNIDNVYANMSQTPTPVQHKSRRLHQNKQKTTEIHHYLQGCFDEDGEEINTPNDVKVYAKNIKMNGICYIKCEQKFRPKKTKFPLMAVCCESCSQNQNIPGNSFEFKCQFCDEFNICSPIYGIFFCGKCEGKVCYQYGLSENIRCTRCQTINKVPLTLPGGKKALQIIDMQQFYRQQNNKFLQFFDKL